MKMVERVRDDARAKGLSGEEVYECATRRRMPSYIDRHKRRNKMKGKKITLNRSATMP